MKKIILFITVAAIFVTYFNLVKKNSTFPSPPVVIPVDPASVAQLLIGKAIKTYMVILIENFA